MPILQSKKADCTLGNYEESIGPDSSNDHCNNISDSRGGGRRRSQRLVRNTSRCRSGSQRDQNPLLCEPSKAAATATTAQNLNRKRVPNCAIQSKDSEAEDDNDDDESNNQDNEDENDEAMDRTENGDEAFIDGTDDSEDRDDDDDLPLATLCRKSTSTTRRHFRNSTTGTTTAAPSSSSAVKSAMANINCRKKAKHNDSRIDDDGDDEFKGTVTPNNQTVARRGRGKLSKRTCPNCQRVFSSRYGLQYHLENLVCDQEAGVGTSNKKRQRRTVPFDTLEPGQRFTSPYGIVQVVSDQRCVPTIPVVDDSSSEIDAERRMKQRLKVYYSSCSKREIQKRKQWQNAAVASRARRVLLGCVYQSITCPGGTPDTIMEEDPACLRAINETLATMRHHHPAQAVVDLAYRFDIARGPTLGSERSRAPPLMADPSAPASCYPDRIVECIWIADQRPRLVILNFGGSDEAGIVMDGLASSNSNKNTRLFLQRRLLTQPYNQDSTRLYCPTCWQCFLSRPGLKYHTESSACIKRASKQSTAIREELELVDQRARKLVAALQPLEAQQRQQHKYDADRRRRVNQMPLSRRRTAPLVMWVDKEGDMDSMGAASNVRATVVPIRSTDTIFINQEGGSSIRHTVDTIISMCNERDETVDGIGAEAENSHSGILSPDDMIAQLQGELHYAQGQILGPMYPQVWKALGYVVPRKKVPPRKKRKRSLGGDDAATMKHSAETDSAIKAEASIADVDRPGALKDALIVDTRTLVAEVNAGRYPSFRRFFGEHLHHCAICSYKTSPPNITPNTQATLTSNHLFPCVFCQRAIHLSCAQTKYIIKEPEPEEDFMCHHCIGIIVSRRSRAEQRRQDRKQPPVSCTTSGIDIVSGSSRAPSQRRTLDHHLQRHLMIGVVTGRELECVAMQSQRVGELAELLRDAQSRLSMTMTVVNMNNARRRACQE